MSVIVYNSFNSCIDFCFLDKKTQKESVLEFYDFDEKILSFSKELFSDVLVNDKENMFENLALIEVDNQQIKKIRRI